MKKVKRSTPSEPTVSEVKRFYEGTPDARLRCVVTEKDVEVELHHIDENPSHSDNPWNFIPLNSSLNKNIDKRKSRILDEKITRDGLAARSAFYYSRGRYSYGYGCSILGVSLAANIPWKAAYPNSYYIDADSAIFFAANALINLRPLSRVDYATHLLMTQVSPIIAKYGLEIEWPTLARIAMEIGSYFRDAGDYKTAQGFTSLARFMLDGEPRSTRVKVLLARLWQHEGIVKIIQGDIDGASDCFKRATDEITIEYSIGHANQTLYEAQILLRKERPAFDQINHMVRQYKSDSDPKLVTRWTEIELRLTEAQSDYQRNDAKSKARSFANVSYVLDRIGRLRIIPTRAIFAPVLFGFSDECRLHRLGIQRLVRVLPIGFVSAAKQVQESLKKLTRTNTRKLRKGNPG